MFSQLVFRFSLVSYQSVARCSRRPLWLQQKSRSRARKPALLLLKYHYKKPRARTSTANAKQVKRLKMLTGGKAVRDRDGKIIEAAAFQKGEDETTIGRVQPDRRWFGASSQTTSPLMLVDLCVRQH
jgi:hypothetical protein